MSVSLVFDIAVQVVFWTTILSAVCALLDRLLSKWSKSYPASKAERIIRGIEDACDAVGSIFKSKLAPRPWSGDDRREAGDGAAAGK
jgi:hypothetical protein